LVRRLFPPKKDLAREEPRDVPVTLHGEMLEVLRSENVRLEREIAQLKQKNVELDEELRKRRKKKDDDNE
jgi:hypothetical protein